MEEIENFDNWNSKKKDIHTNKKEYISDKVRFGLCILGKTLDMKFMVRVKSF